MAYSSLSGLVAHADMTHRIQQINGSAYRECDMFSLLWACQGGIPGPDLLHPFAIGTEVRVSDSGCRSQVNHLRFVIEGELDIVNEPKQCGDIFDTNIIIPPDNDPGPFHRLNDSENDSPSLLHRSVKSERIDMMPFLSPPIRVSSGQSARLRVPVRQIPPRSRRSSIPTFAGIFRRSPFGKSYRCFPEIACAIPAG